MRFFLTQNKNDLHICFFLPEGTTTEKYTEQIKVETTEVRLLSIC